MCVPVSVCVSMCFCTCLCEFVFSVSNISTLKFVHTAVLGPIQIQYKEFAVRIKFYWVLSEFQTRRQAEQSCVESKVINKYFKNAL